MNSGIGRNSRLVALVSILGLASFAWSGCDRSGGEKASSQSPAPSESSTESGGSEEAPSGSTASDDRPGASAKSKAKKKPSARKRPSTAAPSKRKRAQRGRKKGRTGGEVTDEELEEFAAVSKKLRKRVKPLKKKMKAAESRRKKKMVKLQLMKATQKRVRESSLGQRRFGQIAKQLQGDPKLQGRLRKLMNESPDSDSGP